MQNHSPAKLSQPMQHNISLSPLSILKTCSRCLQVLPATREFFYADKRLSDRLYVHCKTCQRGASRREGWTKRTYLNMVQRCCNPRARNYHWYGAKGVKVCERWLQSYANFLADMGECPGGKTLGRFGDVGDYSKENCSWQTRAEQGQEQRKKRRAVIA